MKKLESDLGANDKDEPIRIDYRFHSRQIYRTYSEREFSFKEVQETNKAFKEQNLYSDFESKLKQLEQRIDEQAPEKNFWNNTKRTILATIIVGAVGFAFTEVPKQYLIHQWTKTHFQTKSDCRNREAFVWFPQKKDLIEKLCKDIGRMDIAF